MNRKGFTLIDLMVVIVVIGIIFAVVFHHIHYLVGKRVIEGMGYDFNEVEVFCRLMKVNNRDFIQSEGLRKQYQKFQKGELDDFLSRKSWYQE